MSLRVVSQRCVLTHYELQSTQTACCLLTAHSSELLEPENKHWQWLVSNRHHWVSSLSIVMYPQSQYFTESSHRFLSKKLCYYHSVSLYSLYIITGVSVVTLSPAAWQLSEIMLSARAGAGRATPDTPGQSLVQGLSRIQKLLQAHNWSYRKK